MMGQIIGKVIRKAALFVTDWDGKKRETVLSVFYSLALSLFSQNLVIHVKFLGILGACKNLLLQKS